MQNTALLTFMNPMADSGIRAEPILEMGDAGVFSIIMEINTPDAAKVMQAISPVAIAESGADFSTDMHLDTDPQVEDAMPAIIQAEMAPKHATPSAMQLNLNLTPPTSAEHIDVQLANKPAPDSQEGRMPYGLHISNATPAFPHRQPEAGLAMPKGQQAVSKTATGPAENAGLGLKASGLPHPISDQKITLNQSVEQKILPEKSVISKSVDIPKASRNYARPNIPVPLQGLAETTLQNHAASIEKIPAPGVQPEQGEWRHNLPKAPNTPSGLAASFPVQSQQPQQVQPQQGASSLPKAHTPSTDVLRNFDGPSKLTPDVPAVATSEIIGQPHTRQPFLGEYIAPKIQETRSVLRGAPDPSGKPVDLIGTEMLVAATAGALFTPAESTFTAPPGAEVALARHIAAQVAQVAQTAPSTPVGLALNPEELGRIQLTFTTENGALSVGITAERPETLDLMRRHIDALAQDLRSIGYRDVNFDFSAGGENDSGSTSEGSAHSDKSSGQSNPATDENLTDGPAEVRAATSLLTSETQGVDLRL